jgi:hypothetical protein
MEETKCYCGHTKYCDCGPEEPKQETSKQEKLKEASKNYSERHQDVSGTLGKYLVSAVFQDGAKWQQEQIGKSEFLQKLRATKSDAEARRLIFEQFKNK